MSIEQTFHAVPAAGLTVRDPLTREPLPKKGRKVPRSTYWLRRLRDGSVTDRDAAPAPPTQSPSPGGDGEAKGSTRGKK